MRLPVKKAKGDNGKKNMWGRIADKRLPLHTISEITAAVAVFSIKKSIVSCVTTIVLLVLYKHLTTKPIAFCFCSLS